MAKGDLTMIMKQFLFYLTIMTTGLLLVLSFAVSAATVARISTDELQSRLGESGLHVLDVRSNGDWVSSNEKIIGAERVELSDLDQWADSHSRDDTLVLYCA